MNNLIPKTELPIFARYMADHGWSTMPPVRGRIVKFVKTNTKTKYFVFVEPHDDTHYKVKHLDATAVSVYFKGKSKTE